MSFERKDDDKPYNEDLDPILNAYKQFWAISIENVIDNFLSEQKDPQSYYKNYQKLMIRMEYATFRELKLIDEKIKLLEALDEAKLGSREWIFLGIAKYFLKFKGGAERVKKYFEKAYAQSDPLGGYLLAFETSLKDGSSMFWASSPAKYYRVKSSRDYNTEFIFDDEEKKKDDLMRLSSEQGIYFAEYWLYSNYHWIAEVLTDDFEKNDSISKSWIMKSEEFLKRALAHKDPRAIRLNHWNLQQKKIKFPEDKAIEAALEEANKDLQYSIKEGFPDSLAVFARVTNKEQGYEKNIQNIEINSIDWEKVMAYKCCAAIPEFCVDNYWNDTSLLVKLGYFSADSEEQLKAMCLPMAKAIREITDFAKKEDPRYSTKSYWEQEQSAVSVKVDVSLGYIFTICKKVKIENPEVFYLGLSPMLEIDKRNFQECIKRLLGKSEQNGCGILIKWFEEYAKEKPTELLALMLKDEKDPLYIINKLQEFTDLKLNPEAIQPLLDSWNAVLKKPKEEIAKIFKDTEGVASVVLSYLFENSKNKDKVEKKNDPNDLPTKKSS